MNKPIPQSTPESTVEKSRVNKSALADLMMAMALIISLLMVLYLMPSSSFNPFTIAIFFLIMIPTMKALIRGAPFVPTPMLRVKKMLAVANIKKGEKVYDIGCGDGRMVYLAAKDYQANAVGLELSPLVYALAKVRQFFWRSKAKVIFRDFYYQNLKDADVIMCYLLPDTLARLQTKLEKELKKGARIVSYAFQIGDWKPDRREERDTKNNLAPIWIYER